MARSSSRAGSDSWISRAAGILKYGRGTEAYQGGDGRVLIWAYRGSGASPQGSALGSTSILYLTATQFTRLSHFTVRAAHPYGRR